MLLSIVHHYSPINLSSWTSAMAVSNNRPPRPRRRRVACGFSMAWCPKAAAAWAKATRSVSLEDSHTTTTQGKGIWHSWRWKRQVL